MKLTARYLLILILVAIFGCEASWSWYPAPKADMSLPLAAVINETDQTIDIREAFGPASQQPALLIPVFTRCQMSCPVLVQSLEKAMKAGSKQGKFRIVLLSFDASDTSADLRMFRTRENIPAAWVLVRAKDSNTIRQFFDQYSFSIMDSDGGFSHPSELFVLDSSLKWKGSLLGPDLTAKDLSQAEEMTSNAIHLGSNPEALLIFGFIGLLGSLTVAFYLALRPSARKIAESR